jgi:microcystin-dependent protein
MADTNTPILNLLLQETGGNNNAWGTNLNNEVITPLENAAAGCLTITGLTGGAYSLTQTNAVYRTIKLQGTLASDLIITVPSTANQWTFINELTHAGFFVLIKKSGGTAVNIPHGKVTEISTDGTTMYRHDGENVGELFYHAGTAVPGGALECNGATPIRLSAVDLYAKCGTTWGVGNGVTTFTLPDGYTAGKFLRSRTATVALGTAQTNQNKAHTHNVTGTLTAGTLAIDSGGAHTHTATSTDAGHTHPFQGIANFVASTSFNTSYDDLSQRAGTLSGKVLTGTANITTTINSGGAHVHTISGVPAVGTLTALTDGGTEARPENLSAILCIRY